MEVDINPFYCCDWLPLPLVHIYQTPPMSGVSAFERGDIIQEGIFQRAWREDEGLISAYHGRDKIILSAHMEHAEAQSFASQSPEACYGALWERIVAPLSAKDLLRLFKVTRERAREWGVKETKREVRAAYSQLVGVLGLEESR